MTAAWNVRHVRFSSVCTQRASEIEPQIEWNAAKENRDRSCVLQTNRVDCLELPLQSIEVRRRQAHLRIVPSRLFSMCNCVSAECMLLFMWNYCYYCRRVAVVVANAAAAAASLLIISPFFSTMWSFRSPLPLLLAPYIRTRTQTNILHAVRFAKHMKLSTNSSSSSNSRTVKIDACKHSDTHTLWKNHCMHLILSIISTAIQRSLFSHQQHCDYLELVNVHIFWHMPHSPWNRALIEKRNEHILRVHRTLFVNSFRICINIGIGIWHIDLIAFNFPTYVHE